MAHGMVPKEGYAVNKKKENQSCPRVDIGGQAVMEGVMMRSPDRTAIAVRRPDKSIVVKCTPYEPYSKKHPWAGIPFIRGAVNMVSMLVIGMNTLQDSTTMLGILDEEPSRFEKWLAKKLGKGVDKIVMGVAVVLAVVLAVGLFMALPAFLETLLIKTGMAAWAYTLLSGLLKILILIGYMIAVAQVPDVRRTFQYHGAEHKTVYCHEADLPLTPENAQTFITLHPRCGTAFLLIVFFISILLFVPVNILLQKTSFNIYPVRLGAHLIMLPLVAGVSYEVLKGLAHSDSKLAKVLRWPGLQMQRLTTRQPDDSMLECAISAMNAALKGLPASAPRTKEGWAILKTYMDSDPESYPKDPSEKDARQVAPENTEPVETTEEQP